MTIGQRLAKTARKALEELAASEFSRETILKACQVAAAGGFMVCHIRPSAHVDVSATEHMKALKIELEKERIDLTWIPHGLPGEIPYKVLEVRWEQKTA